MALIIVLSMLAILVVLIVAMFSVSQTEKNSSDVQMKSEEGRELADLAVNLVMGQIWQATKRENPVASQIWASQPGAIRKYNADGSFNKAFKLYSSPTMVVAGDEKTVIAEDFRPNNWRTLPQQYVDLNEPVIRPDTTGDGVPEIYFPIIDPRAYVPSLSSTLPNGDPNPANPNVEGFWYDATTLQGASYSTAGSVNALRSDITPRLPMPVEWIYVTKDGSMGSLNPAGTGIVLGGGAPYSADVALSNPIVGRIAFWTDDESCKLNINTASEPTPWYTPSFYHMRDLFWAHHQPTAFEYQRYPGHPATVALSTVLFPNQDMELYGKLATSAAYRTALARKESIYSLVPKVNRGGSMSGSVPFWKLVDDETGYKDVNFFEKYVNLNSSIKERLYASVDELLFGETITGNQRTLSQGVDATGSNVNFFADSRDLERARFFLTAQSRVPETNMFGTPRVAIWPVADESMPDYQTRRTGYDRLISFCSTLGIPNPGAGSLGPKTYFFRRKDAYSPTADIAIPRNQQLFGYLTGLLNQTTPGGSNFTVKYDQGDTEQILVEIFDYIRATNLYDGFLAPTQPVLELAGGAYDLDNGIAPFNTTRYKNNPLEKHNIGTLYRQRPQTYKTYTYDRASRNIRTTPTPGLNRDERSVDKSFPGHGTVVPSKLGTTSLGFGRFVTVTEVGFHFICTGDGTPDKGSYRRKVKLPATAPNGATHREEDVPASNAGGRTALRIDRHSGPGAGRANPETFTDFDTKQVKRRVWYSNFPVKPGNALLTKWGLSGNASDPANFTGRPQTNNPNGPQPHPGLIPSNWNSTLDFDPARGGIALEPGEKRVQGQLNLELAVPASGYTKINPEFSLVIEGLSNCELDGEPLYSHAGSTTLVWKSGQELFDSDSSRGLGGCVNAFAMLNGRRLRSPNTITMPDDPDYDRAAGVTSGDRHAGLLNFDLSTKFVTVGEPKIEGVPEKTTMAFTADEPLVIKIYGSHEISPANLVQTINVRLPSKPNLPIPELVTMSADHEQWTDAEGNIAEQEAVEAPRYWSFHWGGAIGRFQGTFASHAFTPANALSRRTAGRAFNLGGSDRLSRGRFPRGKSNIYGYDPNNDNYSSQLLSLVNPGADSTGDVYADTKFTDLLPETLSPRNPRGTDVVFTVVPVHSDARLIAAKQVVPASEWVPHPAITLMNRTSGRVFAHNLSRYGSGTEPGFDRDGTPFNNRLVKGAY